VGRAPERFRVAVTPGAGAEAIFVADDPKSAASTAASTAVQLDAPTATLDFELNARRDPQAHRYWTNLMKGEAVFRGVPMAGIRASVRRVWSEHDLESWSVEDLLALAQRWFAGASSEEQLAAVLLLAEHAHGRLRLEHVDELAAPLAAGHVRDWNVTDWYATKALHAFLTGGGELEARARALVGWTSTPALWHRRAGLVAFVKLAPRATEAFDGFVPMILDACANNLAHHGRFAHTGPGWVLRELSRAVPEAVASFVEAHPEMSAEAQRMATARLRPGPYRRR
jgi:3-methyladenine DNA glycosylase AlkD